MSGKREGVLGNLLKGGSLWEVAVGCLILFPTIIHISAWDKLISITD